MTSRLLTITVGSEITKICDVSISAQKAVTVHSVLTVNTPEDAVDDGLVKNVPLLAQSIKSALIDAKIIGKSVIFSIQSSRIANKEVVTPDLKPKKIAEYINANATEYFPVSIEDYIVTYQLLETITDENIKKNRVMVAIAPSEIVDSYYELASELGMTIESIDYVGNSTLQVLKLQIKAKDDKPSVVIQLAEDHTVITIIRNNVMQLMRTVPYGKSTVATALMEKREITYEEAVEAMKDTRNVIKSSFDEGDYVTDSLKYLVNNISRIIDYYKSKNAVEEIEDAYLLTEGNPIYGIDALFSYELAIPNVTRLDTLESVNIAQSVLFTGGQPSTYLPNIGAPINPVGFVPKSVAEKAKKESSNKYFGLLILVSILIALVMVSIPLLSYFDNLDERNDYQRKVKSLKYVEDVVAEYYNAKDKNTDMANFDKLAYNNDDYLGDFVAYLENRMPADISISSMTVKNGAVTMTFSASSKQSVAAFIMALKEKENISDVYVPSINESIDAYGVITVSSSLTCYFTKPAEPITEEPTTEAPTAEETTTPEENSTEEEVQ